MQAEEAEPNISLLIVDSIYYMLIFYVDNQVIVVDNILNDQCPGNENLMNENSNLADRNAALYDPPINISENSNFIHCKGCKKNCHPDLFHDLIRNKTFKQCTDCRRRCFNRRHPDSRQQPPIACEWENQSFNFTNFFDKVPLNPPIVSNFDTVVDNTYIYCRKCRKNCPTNLFDNPGSTSLYATCIDCRTQEHARQFPTVFESIPIQGPSEYLGKISNYKIIGILMTLLG